MSPVAQWQTKSPGFNALNENTELSPAAVSEAAAPPPGPFTATTISFARHQFPPDIIRHAV